MLMNQGHLYSASTQRWSYNDDTMWDYVYNGLALTKTYS
ncbi:hypothetical protein J2Y73_000418 [Peribacillus frigoritolerans]|nr:hypothetical protein [Peribacillus frigoritolerans]